MLIVNDSSATAALQSKPTVAGISEICFAMHIYFCEMVCRCYTFKSFYIVTVQHLKVKISLLTGTASLQ